MNKSVIVRMLPIYEKHCLVRWKVQNVAICMGNTEVYLDSVPANSLRTFHVPVSAKSPGGVQSHIEESFLSVTSCVGQSIWC